MLAVFPVEGLGGGQQGEGRLRRRGGVRVRIGILEDGHEPVAGGLIDVAAGLLDEVEERGEEALDESIK